MQIIDEKPDRQPLIDQLVELQAENEKVNQYNIDIKAELRDVRAHEAELSRILSISKPLSFLRKQVLELQTDNEQIQAELRKARDSREDNRNMKQLLLIEKAGLQAENEKMRKALEYIRDLEWDEECENHTGLREAYAYVPRTVIVQALERTE